MGRQTWAESVPLRDFLSSRIDQIRIELLDRIDQANTLQQKILDERDRQYSQRFEAQQQALAAAFQASKALVDGALSAAKEAVTKAEDAANKRFDSVNEFRQTLTDQAARLLAKDVAEARFKAVEDRLASVSSRLDEIKAIGEGAGTLWGWLVGAVGVVIAVAAFVMTFPRTKTANR